MKIICVPKTAQAQINLDFDKAKQDDLITLEIDDTVFDNLLKSGFFSSINLISAVNIDNYEDEKIVDINQLIALSKSNLFDESRYDIELNGVINAIHDLFMNAIAFNTGIYFYF